MTTTATLAGTIHRNQGRLENIDILNTSRRYPASSIL
jgi:hypothetical protein